MTVSSSSLYPKKVHPTAGLIGSHGGKDLPVIRDGVSYACRPVDLDGFDPGDQIYPNKIRREHQCAADGQPGQCGSPPRIMANNLRTSSIGIAFNGGGVWR